MNATQRRLPGVGVPIAATYAAQDPAFVTAAELMRQQHRATFEELLRIALEVAARRGVQGFTSEDVTSLYVSGTIPRNVPGAVMGTLIGEGRIHVIGREKARHKAARGRWINRFAEGPA